MEQKLINRLLAYLGIILCWVVFFSFFSTNRQNKCIVSNAAGYEMKLQSLYEEEQILLESNERNILGSNKIVVVDAGHGGMDSGTCSKDEKYLEKNINLKIVGYMKELLDECGIKVYYTRLTDKKMEPEERVEFINNVKADLVVSIHCNYGKNKDANGVEVLYSSNEERKQELTSKEFSDILKKEILSITHQNDRGLLAGDNIYIISRSKVPIALVEVGFMSNREELKFLLDEGNQQKIAMGLFNGIIRTLEER
ncbi:N-acetylmuramoyl-L-alanine amidase family protein [Anaeromicropila populeti]|uniref:N-acetylmuramoyl-L-alanine amidase n=1 Tax=Anaeromicropila populeti TaxID=37658 RepID=A0A1I6K113_9FIRM|nr:N-acetylmuramoyl-L-alanine amidase [Anaeromicropila populeti]SFR84867.1 N-acetylmuramoyl-L-alanine amidase [Anaeromicropila populeti]